jgi:hypothetical protein
MARPPAKIINTQTFDDGITWEIMATEGQYTILYLGQHVCIRSSSTIRSGFKYFKSTYPNEGSARAQVRRLNKKFMCEDFSYVKAA